MRVPAGPHLRDIHLPPPPGWWPPAPGWWVLVLLVLLGGWLAWWSLRARQPRRRWQQARFELAKLRDVHARTGDSASFAAGVSQLLRRAARLHDAQAATASGDAWRQAISRWSSDRAHADLLAQLDARMYRPQVDLDADAIAHAANAWLRRALLSRVGHHA